jgi:mono/diheme cytochrome c family protein
MRRPFPIHHRLSAAALILSVWCGKAGAEADHQAEFEKEILPVLETHCYECHGDGEDKGKVSFDTFSSTRALMDQTDLWVHVLKNVRGGLMPPPKRDRMSAEEFSKLESWIKRDPLKLDPQNPDPGRVTLRRLNRVEYRNTIRDLMGVEFRAEEEFPADDTGYGFDTIADALTTSPLLLEKYMQAAESIVAKAVPQSGRITPERSISAKLFGGGEDQRWLSLYEPADLAGQVNITTPGTYRILLDANLRGSFAYDPGRADLTWMVDGREVTRQEIKWGDSQPINPSIEVKWAAGTYPVRLTLEPLVGKERKPAEIGDQGPPNVDLQLRGITLVGPLEPEFATLPKNYRRFFLRDEVPQDPAEQARYAAEILRRFATRAFRRPVDEATVTRLTGFAMASAAAPGGSFERGIGKAITAVLASPRFLFRMEEALEENDPSRHPLLDEYSLASRLSYFLWSTMPDDTLYQLAERGELRKNLTAQIDRMLKDERSDQLVSNFAGQWLQTRDVESVTIDARIVLARDLGQEKDLRERAQRFQQIRQAIGEAEKAGDQAKQDALRREMDELRAKFRRNGRRIEFGGSLRTAMRREVEMLFRHVLREDRSILELVDNDSTFLNEELANHYGVPGVQGREMRLVKLPPDSPRGGLVTMGSVLAVTSNPTRTSPVKRGLFILDNILGTPPPPAPPNIPSLETSEKKADGGNLTLRDALALHREQPLCSSCHNRMDPLGLALENFNAMGSWREMDQGLPLESAAGQLITGEKFADVRELKRVLVTARRQDFYHCITEKLLTYALGRGPQPCDITTMDAIVEKLDRTDGKISSLITGIIESPAFQKRQRTLP